MEIILLSIENSPSLIYPVMQEIILNARHDCKCIHIPLEKKENEEIKKIAEDIMHLFPNMDLLGVSCMTNDYPEAVKIIREIKKIKNIATILGGIHPTVNPYECIKEADYVCVGEGEEALLELIKRLESNKRTDNIKNIWTKRGGEIIKNPVRPITPELDKFPPAKLRLDLNYMYYQNKILKLSENRFLIYKYYSKYYYVMTSRGCPYRCKYCLNGALIKIHPDFKRIRRRSNEHVIEELKHIKNIMNRGIVIGFVDDDFCAQETENLRKFCESYKKEINFPFFCASTPTSMNAEKLELLINAGMIRLEIGIQSISDEVNHNIFGRFSNKKQILSLVKVLEKYNKKIQICYDFILDNPWENDKTRIETLDFILSLKKPFTASLFSLTTYPGTELYERAKKEGVIKSDKEVIEKNHMIIQNSSINTLLVLYTKYNFPKSLIKVLTKNRNLWPIKGMLYKSTHFLWRAHNYFIGLKNSIKDLDRDRRNYYLFAPFKKIIRKMKAN